MARRQCTLAVYIRPLDTQIVNITAYCCSRLTNILRP